MPRIITESKAYERMQQLQDASPDRIRGYGVAIEFLDGYAADARLLDQSPVLFPEKALPAEGGKGDRRRFGFVEYAGEGQPPRAGLVRHVGDVFCADRRTAEFVWQAVLEKIESDAAHIAGVEAGLYHR